MDAEYNRLKVTTDSIIAALGLIQKSDGTLANGSVGVLQLSAALALTFLPPKPWLTATAYGLNQAVFINSKFYICQIAHTSTVFANDLAAGDWFLAADFTATVAAGALVNANNLSDVSSIPTARVNLGIDALTSVGDAAYAVLATDRVVATNAALSAPRTWTLPLAASTKAGQAIAIEDFAGGVTQTNTLTVSRNGGDLLNGGTIFVLDRASQGATFYSDGVSKWSTPTPAVLSPLPGYLGGLVTSWASTTQINIAAGVACSDDSTTLMKLPAWAKTTAAWAVGQSSGGLDTGSIAASTIYYVYVIYRPDLGLSDALISASPTGPTMPTNYTKKRRIGAFKTDGSSHIIQYVQFGDKFLYQTGILDVNTAAIGTSRVAVSLSVPVSTEALFRAFANDSGTTGSIVFQTTQETAAIPQTNAAPGISLHCAVATSGGAAGEFQVHADASAQIALQSNSATLSATVVTLGWIDTRGK